MILIYLKVVTVVYFEIKMESKMEMKCHFTLITGANVFLSLNMIKKFTEIKLKSNTPSQAIYRIHFCNVYCYTDKNSNIYNAK